MLLTTRVNDSIFLLVLVGLFLVCVNCNDSKTNNPNSSLEGNHQIFFNFTHNHSIEHDSQNMNSSTRPELELHKQTNSSSHMIQNNISSELQKSSEDKIQRNGDNKGFNQSEVPLEGGGTGVLVQSHIDRPNSNNPTVIEESKDGILASGSKGRKGVTFPGSSIVPRKGVSVLSQSSQKPVQGDVTKGEGIKKVHSKKPEYASDERDTDYSDKYSLIHTSTTGEDYVIIGIVIVIGIWFSVFGALIFYRRAGEYWDRRHYRRMDFLVEGMYND